VTASRHRQELPGLPALSVLRNVAREFRADGQTRENAMPMIFFLWAVPAVIVIGGGTYWLMHVH
jgi:hypothetical protein